MIVSAKAGRFLRSAASPDAGPIMDALERITTAPAAPAAREIGAGVWEARIEVGHGRQIRCLFSYREGEAVILTIREALKGVAA